MTITAHDAENGAALADRRAALEDLLRFAAWRGLDNPGHPHAAVLARLRAALAGSDPARHRTRTAHSWARSEKINRRGAVVRGDESFAVCLCGWDWHDSTRQACRAQARAHREEATRLRVPVADEAVLLDLLDPYGLDRPRRVFTGWTDDEHSPSLYRPSRWVTEAPIVAVEPLPSPDPRFRRVRLTVARPDRPGVAAARLRVTTTDLRYEPDPRFARKVIAGLPPLPPDSALRSHRDPVRLAASSVP
ncbi:hypothetical protein AB0F17_61815 [Nonomuraea sp. NPDC026600]|uniref:hypothetical protein n=1 Tax=Nonomuraea sp. NPDC026600 TaxID=3155363 RepID=UPI0033F61A73